MCETGELTAYEKHTILNMTKKVVDNLTKNFKKIQKEVMENMGGKVLDHEAKDILGQGYCDGYSDGYNRGFNVGYNDGKKHTIVQFIKEGIITPVEGAIRLGMSEIELAKYI